MLNHALCYKDVVAVHCTNHNEYGDDVVESSEEINAIVQENYGWQHAGFQENITSGTIAWLDPEASWVKNNCYRIEGSLLSFNKYCDDTRHIWFKINQVNIVRDHLNCNKIRLIEVSLQKVEEPRWWCEKTGDGDVGLCQEDIIPTRPECTDYCSSNLDNPEDRPTFDAYGTPVEYTGCDCGANNVG